MSNLRIFTDGGSRGNPGDAGIGIVVFDQNNQIIFEHSEFIGLATNNEAEYKALLKALDWLINNKEGSQEVEFFLDSKLVVEQINKNWKIKDDRMRVFANKAWEILKKIDARVRFFHVKRDKNKHADFLVNQALDAQQT